MTKSYEGLTNSNIKQQTRKDGTFNANMCVYTFVRINMQTNPLVYLEEVFISIKFIPDRTKFPDKSSTRLTRLDCKTIFRRF